ncbi:MAG: glycosyltransferase [Anaerolineaceae bacterium]|nr:glycosyltransferase [Anaerolineaceae bacterium]
MNNQTKIVKQNIRSEFHNYLISVIMPVYNGEQFLGEAVESILRQTYQNFEFIIIDDCSSDNSLEIINGFKDKRITLIRNNKNFGVAISLNKGIDNSKGEFIARMDADDVSLPYRLENQIAYLNLYPEIGVLGASIMITDEGGKTRKLKKFPPNHEEIRFNLTICNNPIAHPTVMMRRQILESVGGYCSHAKIEDYNLWKRLLDLTKFANLHEPQLLYRIHSSNVMKNISEQMKMEVVSYSKGIIENIFEKQLKFSQVEPLWGYSIESLGELSAASNLLIKIMQKTLETRPLSRKEKLEIIKISMNRIFLFMKQYIKSKIL